MMKLSLFHSSKMTPKEAVNLQKEWKEKILLNPLDKPPRLVAGVDISFQRGSSIAYYAIVILDISNLSLIEVVTGHAEMLFPYIPGLLAFREVPVLLEGFPKLKTIPHVILCDGHGIAHPRGIGLASHLGLCLDLPTIGCAKRILSGDWNMPKNQKGSFSPIQIKNKKVGFVLRSRKNAKPIFISPGHLIDLEGSLQIVQACLTGYKLPEPTRLAHLYANQERKKEGQ